MQNENIELRKSIEWENIKNLIELSGGIEISEHTPFGATSFNVTPFGAHLRIELVGSEFAGEWLFLSMASTLLCISSNTMISILNVLRDEWVLITIRGVFY